MSEESENPLAPPAQASGASATQLCPILSQVEQSFIRNISDVRALRTMPTLFVCFLGIVKEMGHVSVDYARSIEDGWNIDHDVQRLKLLDEYASDISHFRGRWSSSQDELERMCGDPSYGPVLSAAMRVLKMAVVSSTWTALECVASDCWITALNECPTHLAQQVLSSVPRESDTSDISSKQISFGLAAKYKFDLRHCLGTVLKAKFDFTSISGIRKAYAAAFKGERQLDEFQSLLSTPLLRELELTRNLIVHRASIVDNEYNTQMSMSLALGKPLQITDEQISEFAERVAIVGAAILIFASDFIKEHQ